MFRNYFITAFRNLKRRKSYFLLNITGLAVGLAVSLLIFTIVTYERSFDKTQPDYDRIYNIATRETIEGELAQTPGIPFPALDALRADIPGATFGAVDWYNAQLTVLNSDGTPVPGKKFREESGVYFAEPEYFQVFQYQWLSGNEEVLNDPESIVLCRSVAEKYFGSWQQALGQLVRFDGRFVCKVAAIIEDSPSNTDFPVRVVASFEGMKKIPFFGYTTDWGSITSNFQIFIKRPEQMTEAQLAAQLKTFSKKHYKEGNTTKENVLRPLRTIHFDERGAFGSHRVSEGMLYAFSLVGLLIILMACINFINLSTAQAVLRSKEVGVRKVLGSNRAQLRLLMLGETFLIVFTATLLAAGLAALLLPFVHHVIPVAENLSLFSGANILFLFVTMLGVTLIAGLYPAFVISGFNPSRAIKNKIGGSSRSGIILRRGLVVVQFMVSQVLIIGTLIVINQMDFVRTADLGFSKEGILLVSNNGDSTILAKLPEFKAALQQLPGVKSVTLASEQPSSSNQWTSNFAYDHRDDEPSPVDLKFADPDYFRTFGLQFLAGGPYSPSDTIREVVVNETMLKKLGVKNPADAIGKDFRMGSGAWHPICGVVKDFNASSLHAPIRPIMMAARSRHYFTAGISLQSTNLQKSQQQVQQVWDRFFPDFVFSSTFFEESINAFYEEERKLTILYEIFAGIAILISCLGLYGLISFMTVQKTKEVGVRKVLGAGVMQVIYLFSREFTILIAVAFVLAAPAGWLLMNMWLEDFVYRTSIGFGVFAIAMAGSLLIAWLTVGYKAYRAARANPVNSLRSE